jgi:hypothetical protein
MRITLQLDDDLADQYKALAGKRTLERTMADQLARFQAYSPTAGILILEPAHLGSLHQILGPGATLGPEQLVQAIAHLAKLQVGKIEVILSPKQWEAVLARAEKQGRGVDQLCRDAGERVLQELGVG